MTINMERISNGWKMDVNCNSGEDKPTTAVTPRAYGAETISIPEGTPLIQTDTGNFYLFDSIEDDPWVFQFCMQG